MLRPAFKDARDCSDISDIKERGIDELNPIWNVMDLTPQERGKWYASLEYGIKVQAARS